MSDFLKKGWHPKGKEGAKESWRGDFKGVDQVAGWMGKGKRTNSDKDSNTHIARPLATLKDPSLFGPPPKNVNYHGGAALPNEITPHTSGLGAPLSQVEIESARRVNTPAQEVEEEEEEQPQRAAAPPLPYRADRTGLVTSNLPAPPVRTGGTGISPAIHTDSTPKPSPGLPPRLPSRQNTTSPSPTSTVPPPAYESVGTPKAPAHSLNQSAMNRLGNAGISVPAFGIGKNNSSADTESNPWRNEKPPTNSTSQMSELQSRFARMTNSAKDNTSSSEVAASSPEPKSQAQPPSWQQTQSSLRTAQNLRQNPSQVTLADAQQAANTAQAAHNSGKAFREKHADKFDAAERKATTLNKKYNVTGRLNKFLEEANDDHDKTQQSLQQQQQQQPGQVSNNQYQNPTQTANTSIPTSTPTPQPLQSPTPQTNYTIPTPTPPSQYQRQSPPPPNNTATTTTTAATTTTKAAPVSIGRKPPPPPPPKKPASMQTGHAAPPPVPLGTRPTFS